MKDTSSKKEAPISALLQDMTCNTDVGNNLTRGLPVTNTCGTGVIFPICVAVSTSCREVICCRLLLSRPGTVAHISQFHFA
eukprot:7149633-Pyramimonas_sp.AAC.1